MSAARGFDRQDNLSSIQRSFEEACRLRREPNLKGAGSEARTAAEAILQRLYADLVEPDTFAKANFESIHVGYDTLRNKVKSHILEYLGIQFELIQKIGNKCHHPLRTVLPVEIDNAIGALESVHNWFFREYLKVIPDQLYLSLTSLDPEKFSGREGDLVNLHTLLVSGAYPVVIHGQTGLGKTELARQYANHQRDTYDGVVFIYARTLADIPGQIQRAFKTRFGHEPQSPIGEELSSAEEAHQYWAAWNTGFWLVIFDDSHVKPSEVRAYFPRRDRVRAEFRVIVTSQVVWPLEKPGTNYPLHSLDENAGLLLFSRFLGADRVEGERSAASRVVRWLGGLPVALEFIARYMQEHPAFRFDDVVAYFESKGIGHVKGMNADRGWEESFELVWQELSEPARQLLHLACCLPQGPIAWPIVEASIRKARPGPPGGELLYSKASLSNWHLFNRLAGVEIYTIHDMVRRATRLKMSIESASPKSSMEARDRWSACADLRNALCVVLREQSIEFMSARAVDRVSKWQHYVEPWKEIALDETIEVKDDARIDLLCSVCQYRSDQGIFKDVLELIDRPLLKRESLLRHMPLRAGEVWRLLTTEAVKAWKGAGKYEESLRELNSLISETPPGERSKISLLIERADIERLTGDYGTALVSYREAESQTQHFSVDDHEILIERARAEYGSGRMWRLTGAHGLAREAYENARGLYEAAGSTGSVHHAWAEFGLGEIERLSWRLPKSHHFYQSAHKVFKGLKASDGQAYAAWGLAECARLQARYGTAEDWFRESQELCQTTGDPRSEVWAIMGLGCVQLHRGDHAAALSLLESALKMAGEIIEKAHLKLCIALVRREMGIGSLEDYQFSLDVYEARGMKYCLAHTYLDRALCSLPGEDQSAKDFHMARELCIQNSYEHELNMLTTFELSPTPDQRHILNLP
jgi:tetratricopeptide (TPR) repeat protein